MVLDTSAILAVLFDEPEATTFAVAISADPVRLLSVVSLVEASLVITSRFGDPGERELDLLLHRAAVEVTSIDSEQGEAARRCFRDWGRGRHRAALNFGDCFAYALSRVSHEPLLCKGDDFRLTDAALVIE